MNKKIMTLGCLIIAAAMNAGAANTEFFLTEKTAAQIKDSAYEIISNADFKEENGVSYISVDTIKNLYGAKEENGVLSLNGKTVNVTDSVVPLKSTLEALGFIVKYSPTLDSVFVSDKPAAMTVDGEKVPYEEFKFYYDINSVSNMTEDQSVMLKDNITKMLTEITAVSKEAQNSGFNQLLMSESLNKEIGDAAKGFRTAPDFKGISEHTLDTTYANTLERRSVAISYTQVAEAAISVTDEDINKYYAENFVSAKHILIPTIDIETGISLDEEGIKAAEKTIKELEEKIKKGEDFDKLMNTYSKDTGLEAYPDGYTFTKGEMVEEFEKTAFELEENEISNAVRTTYGYHIIKRLPLRNLDDSLKANIGTLLKQTGMSDYIDGIINKCVVEVNEEVINSVK